MRVSQKMVLLTCLYLAQGLPYGFFKQALPVMMRDRGASLPEIGLLSLLTLPWALKFLWAPLVDGLGGRRRWIFWLQVVSCLLFLGLGAWNPDSGYGVLAWGFFLANLLAATQDIASDGLAVTILAPHERGWGNGIQVAGYRVGMILGGGFILMAFGLLGWRGMFWLIAAMMVLCLLPLLWATWGLAAGSADTKRVLAGAWGRSRAGRPHA